MSVKTRDDGTYELDAREIEGEPFDNIMTAVDNLDDDESLVLVNSFEPVPLYNVLEQRGFEHETDQRSEEEWHVSIRPA